MGQRRYELLQHLAEGTRIVIAAAVAIAAILLIMRLLELL